MIRNTLFAIALAVCAPMLGAQSTQVDLNARLLKKPLYLLGRWRSDHLKFDAAGRILGKPEAGPFTLSGIDVDRIDLSPKGLTIRGSRIGLVFYGDEVRRVSLPLSIVIQIASPPNGEYGPSLDSIFTDKLGVFVPSLPEYWQAYGTKHLLHPLVEVATSEDKDGPPLPGEGPPPVVKPPPGIRKIGGEVSPPKLLKIPEPQFSREARSVKISGNVLVYLQVDTAGNPTKIRLLRPLGLGLDEKAVEAVGQYKFKPASVNGIPVAVEMNV